ncbi:hypothetical protein DFP72DRAFT_863305 [Ephemerocybe angulata]|uniref:Uncharacterized protein n=1 Tax=Ephemerocybe angulata TaxID=980116 RepID=A0A8H6H6T4_9AGAR|nr:hypothetical protein DFP72DRAFT_863305 [Tulosesus angulatus]
MDRRGDEEVTPEFSDTSSQQGGDSGENWDYNESRETGVSSDRPEPSAQQHQPPNREPILKVRTLKPMVVVNNKCTGPELNLGTRGHAQLFKIDRNYYIWKDEQLRLLDKERVKVLDGTSSILDSLPRDAALARIAKVRDKVLAGALSAPDDNAATPVEEIRATDLNDRDDPFSLPSDSPYNPFRSSRFWPDYNPYAELEPEPTNKWEPTGPGGPLVETIEFARWIRESALRQGIVPHIPGRPLMTAEQYREISARPDMTREEPKSLIKEQIQRLLEDPNPTITHFGTSQDQESELQERPETSRKGKEREWRD